MTNSRVFTFHSHKGGSGRTLTMVNVGEALTIQGCNVLMIDLDFEASGLPVFSTTQDPNPMFTPDNLFRLDNNRKKDRLYAIVNKEFQADQIIHLPGLLSCFEVYANDESLLSTMDLNSLDLFKHLVNVPVYESRTNSQHPIEGRMFMLPLGGFYKKRDLGENEDKLTPWTYFPPAGDDEKAIHHRLLQHIIQLIESKSGAAGDKHSMSFIQHLIHYAAGLISDICETNIDYVLIDQRAGQTGAGLLVDFDVDGTVLIGLPSTGNLTGLRYLAERSRQTAQKTVRDNPGSDISPAPPVVGMLVNAAPPNRGASMVDRGTQDYARIIADNIDRAGWTNLWPQHEEEQQSWLLSPSKNLSYYFSSQRANFHIEDSDRSLDCGKTIGQYWSLLGFDPEGDPRDFMNHFLVSTLKMDLRVHDQLLHNRQFAWDSSDDELKYESAISVLAAHLRDVDISDKIDIELSSRLKWLNGKLPTIKEVEDSVFGHYFRACAARKGKLYDEALNELKLYNKQLEKRVNGLPAHIHGWKGDWRSSYLRALILQEKNADSKEQHQQIVEAFSLSLEQFDWLITTSGRYNWPIKQSFLRTQNLMLLLRLANFLIDQKKFKEAIQILTEAYKVDDYSRIEDITKLHYLCAQGLIQSEPRSGVDELNRLADDHIAGARKVPTIRDPLAALHIQTKMEWFWQCDSAQSEDIQLILKLCKEWEDAIKKRNHTMSHRRHAKTLFYCGAAILESIIQVNETASNKREGILEALKCFEECAVLQENWPIAHFSLAIGRAVQWRCFSVEYKNEQQTGLTDKDDEHVIQQIKHVRVVEQATRQRDAFYAFEQTFAFLKDKKTANYFFDGEPAAQLANSIELALQELLEHFDNLHLYRDHFTRWLNTLGEPGFGDANEVREIFRQVGFERKVN
jgi:hypothetical protein